MLLNNANLDDSTLNQCKISLINRAEKREQEKEESRTISVNKKKIADLVEELQSKPLLERAGNLTSTYWNAATSFEGIPLAASSMRSRLILSR